MESRRIGYSAISVDIHYDGSGRVLMSRHQEIYDERYKGDYRDRLTGFEVARWAALRHFINSLKGLAASGNALDYGAGSGLHVELWQSLFRKFDLYFCDISQVALNKLVSKYPAYANRCFLVSNHRAELNDSYFDVITSIEVIEHVEDLLLFIKDVYRLLKPRGRFIWTTPCANSLSIEHIFALLTSKIEPTEEGFRRWSWEDPTHVRRLTSKEMKDQLESVGFADITFRYRSHLFSFLCTYTPVFRRLTPITQQIMKLDYLLFRNFPNGASMIGCATAIK